METIKSGAKNARMTLNKGKNTAMLASTLAANQVKQLTSTVGLGPFSNIILSLLLIFILYKVFNTLFYGSFNYSNQLEFIIRSYYYWTLILVILVLYVSFTNM